MSGRVHSTDLKERLLANIPGLQAHKKGRYIFVAFNDEVAATLQQACERDFDNEAMTLLKVHMKPNLFLQSCKTYRLKCMIPKFEMARTKIDDFTSAESWAILPRKMVRGLDRVCCEIPWL